MASGLACLALMIGVLPAAAVPTVFWASEPVQPGEMVLLYGGGLKAVHEVRVWRLSDADPGVPPSQGPLPTGQGLKPKARGSEVVRVQALQPSENSLKFVLPRGMSTGVFGVDLGGERRLINLPKVEWSQPTRLLPGLNQNEAAPGSTVQIIGRNFLLDESRREKVKVALQPPDGALLWPKVVQTDKYAIITELPANLPLGAYQLRVHNGSGGPFAWGNGLTLTIKQPTLWPDEVFNIKDFGARGDNVADDSEGVRKALAAVETNSGGVIYFPHGTYRLSGWFRIPRRVILRGEGKDITWLKWPQTNPKSGADFVPAILYGTGEYVIEHMSIMVRNAKSVLRDLSFDALHNAPAPISAMESFMPPPGETRDIFLRHVRVHYVPNLGRPSNSPESDPQWRFNRWGIINTVNEGLTVAVGGARNIEVSDSELVGIERLLDLQNARLVGNSFSNQMGVSWTDLGGQHMVFEGNRIIGASSWRSALLPLRYLYVAHNTSTNIERGEREALTFDINGLLGERRASPPIEAWQGKVASAAAKTLRLQEAALRPGAYRGFNVLIVDGTGAGQYRTLEDNTDEAVTVSQPWDVPPDSTSVVLLYRLFGHVIFYDNLAEDTSVLGQIWGHLYDAVFDGNEVKRSQGMWGLAGWFVQWLNNRLDVAVTYHTGVGPAGGVSEPTPEGTTPFGYMGFTINGSVADPKQVPIRFPYVRGAVIRSNHLSYGHRVLVMWGYGGERKQANFVAARDIVLDHNQIEHTPIGIELDANVAGTAIAHNMFTDVRERLRLHDPGRVLVLDSPKFELQGPNTIPQVPK
jgi:hypothetical protein